MDPSVHEWMAPSFPPSLLYRDSARVYTKGSTALFTNANACGYVALL